MKTDPFGITYYSSDELSDLLYKDPTAKIDDLMVEDPSEFNRSVTSLHLHYAMLKRYIAPNVTVEEFDKESQSDWFMPDEYKNLDIAERILSQCKTEEEFQRVGKELLMYQERNLFDLLRFMKYFVDTMRKNNVVWGVGRGSSVSSYVLFLLGVHRINSIYYDLDINEFLK